MTGTMLMTAVALVGGLIVLRRLGRGRSRRVVSTDDLAIVLASSEIVQLLWNTSELQVRLGVEAPAVLPLLCLVAVGLVVTATVVSWIGLVVTGLGLLAALAQTLLDDGPGLAGAMLSLVALMWLINRLTRVLIG